MIHRFGRFELRPDARLLLADGKPVELGARAFDVLQALVERRDRVVTKDELLDIAWPGVIVEENNLHVQVSTLRKVLGAHAIKTIPGRGYRFALDDGSLLVENAPAGDVHVRGSLPRMLTSFIGHESELAENMRLLAQTRVLTLTGIGGAGKTRVAVELARRVLPSFPDGVWFVDLAPVAAPERVAPTVAATLGLREEAERPILDTVCARLEGARALIVLDNCEHLVDACAALVEAMLARTSATVLATSRERLGVAGERTASVRPMMLASPGAGGSAREECEAVRLFVDRARAAAHDFVLEPQNLVAVEEICRRLECLPLAIELAAARVNVLSVDEISARLDDRFRLLTAGSRTRQRHQTLRAVMDWSYELLDPHDRQALRSLSVFAGGWTLAAAAAVIAALDEFETIETLSRLVDKSLVLVERDATGQPRYRMLETVRAYARERMEAAGEAREVRQRHLDYYLALAENQPKSHDMVAAAAFRRLDAELDNFMAAHEWCDEEPAAAEAGLRLVVALAHFLDFRAHLRLWRAIAEHALARPGAPKNGVLRAKALGGAGGVAFDLGDYDAGTAYFSQALAMAREAGHTSGEIGCLRNLATAAMHAGDFPRARLLLEESLALARTVGSRRDVAADVGNLGELCRIEGNFNEAVAHYEESLATFRALGQPTSVALLNLMIVAAERLDYREACRYLVEAAAETKALRSHHYACWLPPHAAALVAAIGDAQFAARMWGAWDSAREATGVVLQRADRDFINTRVEAARQALGDAAFDEAYAAGHELSLDEATAEIEAWLHRYLHGTASSPRRNRRPVRS